MSAATPAAEQQPHVAPITEGEPLSSTGSSVSASELKQDDSAPMMVADENGQQVLPEMPVKPNSAYIGLGVMCLMVAFGGFVFGYDTGSIGGFVAMSGFKEKYGSHNSSGYYLSNVRTGLIVSIFNIGCAIGGITLGKLGDMYGRKIGLMCVTIVYIVGIVIQIAAVHAWYQYFIGRIISGLGVGGIAVLSPMMISETAPKHLRGLLVSCYQLMITLGIFLGYCINYGTKGYTNTAQWRITLGLCFLWALFMLGGMTFVPETARYYCEKDRVEDARESLSKVNKVPKDDPALQAELDTIVAGVEAERLAGEASWKELFSTKTKIFQRLVMGVMLQSLQQLTGDNYFFYYGTTVFAAVGLSDSFQTSIVIGIVNFASTFFGLFFVNRFGRRTLLLWGAAAQVACFVVFASVGVTRLWPDGAGHPENSSKGAGNCMIVFTCFYIFCFAVSWAPLIYVVVSESYPLRVRSKCMAIATGANWIWGFLISFFTPFITNAIHFAYGYVFMGCLVFSFFYVFFVVPETKSLSLEEVEEMWQEGVLPWKSSSWVPASRRGVDYSAEALQHDEKKGFRRFF
ncbi:Hexose transporter 2 [Hanseniaspora osmophila]|uniref:Hexose transporter 2 n=1 Tax=Hanseniaspora osmophila TaxID=56408 RepID=A0A1E5R2D2_9ASCO|nr:Hexose transporter 2 [Hanseniaspora osmophila]